MTTLFELGQEAVKIREALNSIEVKGRQNAALVVYCCDRCDNIIKAINEAVTTISASKNENIVSQDTQSANDDPIEEEGDVNEQDSRTP